MRSRWTGGLLLLALCAPGQTTEPPSDIQDVVFESANRPIRLRLHILIDGRPFTAQFQQAWDDYLKALFKFLDSDSDGFLSEAEARRLPSPSAHLGGVNGRPTNLAFNFPVVDANGDGKLDFTEFAAFYRDYGSTGLHVQVAARPDPLSSQVGRILFDRLDRNQDGKLSHGELQVAGAQMGLDRDDDELLSPLEMAPRISANMAAIAPPARRGRGSESAFLFSGWDKSPEAIIQRLRDRYGAKGEIIADRPDLELRIRLGTIRPGEKPIELMKSNDSSIHVSSNELGFTLWLSDSNTLLEFHVNMGKPCLPQRWRRKLLDQFAAAGGDHLSRSDAKLHGFYPQQFDLLDRNFDGVVTPKELDEYLNQLQVRQAKAVTNVISVLVSIEGRDLFDLLDRNCDGRLSMWELRSAQRILAQIGQTESLDRNQVPVSYHIALGLGRASFNRSGGIGAFAPRGLPMLTLDWSDPKLVWFHKMDRNGDGYISRREFLGSAEMFRKLDADGDELISPEEALRTPGK